MYVEYGQTMALISMNCYMILVWTKIIQADEVEWQANLRTTTENQVQQNYILEVALALLNAINSLQHWQNH